MKHPKRETQNKKHKNPKRKTQKKRNAKRKNQKPETEASRLLQPSSGSYSPVPAHTAHFRLLQRFGFFVFVCFGFLFLFLFSFRVFRFPLSAIIRFFCHSQTPIYFGKQNRSALKAPKYFGKQNRSLPKAPKYFGK